MSKDLVKDHNKNGLEAANKGDFITAEKEFYKAFNLNPLNPGLLFNFLKVLHVQKKYTKIVDFVSKSSIETKKSWNPSILSIAGDSAIKLNNDNLALELFGTLNEKNPQNVEYSLPYSQVLLKVGNLNKAAEVIIKCLKSNSSNPSLLTNLAIIKSELGDYKEAEVLYLKVIKFTSTQFLGYYNYALFLYNQNRFQNSLEQINKALTIVPNAPEGLKVKKKLLERVSSNQNNINIISKAFKAIELAEWQAAYEILSKIKDSEKDAKFISAITYLPQNFQQKFGDIRQFDPRLLVKKIQLFNYKNEIIKKLINLVKTQETLVWNRPEKPTVEGYQSHEINGDNDGQINDLIGEKLLKISKEYLYSDLGADKYSNNINFKISGWCVVLLSGGKQLRHIHPESLVSGVLYLQVPKSVSDTSNNYGNLLFPAFNKLSVTPEVGKVILFPSYLPHETVDFSSEEERICIAFNLVDRRNN